ncbi:MAG TPA: acetylglutamate kinase, partial [Blastocatellia bacterium]|nr:acetylglutamate kinase [Blastocatellia bacterium]
PRTGSTFRKLSLLQFSRRQTETMTEERLDLLREALPYIQRFKNDIFVVKLSGKITENQEQLNSLAEEITLCQQVGIRVAVVHGGGKQLSAIAERLGITQRIVNGRRVTDADTLEIAKMVFGGQINTDIISALRRTGAETVGLSGVDGGIIKARRRDIQEVLNRDTGEVETVDFGHVGDIVEINSRLIKLLLDNGYVPVLSSLGADDQGNVYNINADTIAAEIAAHLRAEKLILMTDVDGILLDRDDPTSRISRLTLEEADRLVEQRIVSEGMIPKISAIANLIRRGVKSAHIINGSKRNALLREVFTDEGAGTMLTM